MYKLLIIIWSTIYLLHFQSWVVKSQESKIDNDLLSHLEQNSKANVIVSFQNGIEPTIKLATATRYADKASKRQAIVSALEENAEVCQSSLIQMLSSTRSSGGYSYFRSFWPSNTLYIKDADKATVTSVSEDPEVARIQLEPIYKIPVPTIIERIYPSTELLDEPPTDTDFNQWRYNLFYIKTFEAWEELKGNKGEGVVVATIDTGARHTHVQLRDSFLGEYGWYDAIHQKPEPYDPISHGSHVLGIIVGHDPASPQNEQIGIAPGAKWMACLACETDDCNWEHVMSCLEFIICPTLADGSNRNCSKAPHILNFSIGGDHKGEPFDEVFGTLRELGIIPVAAIGNRGPKCGTTDSPAQWPFAIGVGVTSHNWNYQEEDLIGVSSIGPAFDGGIKPDLVAPGHNSVGPVGDDDEQMYFGRGTSNATPHVAGVLALLHARNPEITYDEAYELLTKNADTNINLTNKESCNETSDVIPNNFIGWGRVNAFRSVKAQSILIEQAKKRR